MRRFLIAFLLCVAPTSGGADYVREEVQVSLRSGPGADYGPVKLLRTGDEVIGLERRQDWSRVRTAEGDEGWVPTRFLQPHLPATLALPKVEAKLRAAQERVRELEAEITTREEQLEELDGLRQQLEGLEQERTRLAGSSRWKELLTGAGIVVIGMMIGTLLGRGDRSRRRLRI